MNISVIIATYRRSEILNRTLDSFNLLQCKDLKWDLWVVDNADDPETKQIVTSWNNKLPINYLVETKAGKNHALNHAIPMIKGQLMVFTDDDIIARSDWLRQLWEGAQRWPDHFVFGGRIIADWPDGIPFWGDDHPLNQSLFSLHSPTREERPYGDGDFLPYGANLAIRREIFDKGYRYNTEVGPDGSNTYVMGSETQLLKRLKKDGYDPIFLPRAVVQHQIRKSQLTRAGLNTRNFRVGLTVGQTGENNMPLLLGAPRYLWKQLIQTMIKRGVAKLFSNKIKSFELNCSFWRIKGIIYGNCSKRNKSRFIQSLMKLGI